MVIIALADIHGHVGYLPTISKELGPANLVIVAGDLTHFGGRDEAKRILSALRESNPHILAVPGNCDRQGVDDYLTTENVNLSCNCITIDGIDFVGMGGSLPCPGKTPNELGEDEFDICLREPEKEIRSSRRVVLVTHQPAKNTLVDAVGDRHAGSSAIADFIVRNEPILAISGHIHEAAGIDRIGPTTLVNPGPFSRGSYAYIEINEKVNKIEIRMAQ